MNSIGALQPQVASNLFSFDVNVDQLLNDINTLTGNEPISLKGLQDILSLVQRFIECSKEDQQQIKERLVQGNVQIDLFIVIVNLVASHQEIGQIFLDHLTLVGQDNHTASLRNLYSALSDIRDIFSRDLLDNPNLCKNLADLCYALDRLLEPAFLEHAPIQQFGALLRVSAQFFDPSLPDDIQNDPRYMGEDLIQGCMSAHAFIQQNFSFCPHDIDISLKYISRKVLYWYAENKVSTANTRTLLVAVRRDISKTDTLILEMLYLRKKGKKYLHSHSIAYDQHIQFEDLVNEAKNTKVGKESNNIIFIDVAAEKIEELAENYYANHMIAEEMVLQIQGLNAENSGRELLEEVINIFKQSDALDELELVLLRNYISRSLAQTPFIDPIKKLLEILSLNREIGKIFLDHLALVAGNQDEESIQHLYLALSQVQKIYNNDLNLFPDTCKAIALSCTGLCENFESAFPNVEFKKTFDQLIGTSAYIVYGQISQNIKDSPYYFGEALLRAYTVGSQLIRAGVASNLKNIREASTEICRDILSEYVARKAITADEKKSTVIVLVRPSSSQPAISCTNDTFVVFEELHISNGGHDFRSVRCPYKIDENKIAWFAKKKQRTQNLGESIVDRFKRKKEVILLNSYECQIEEVAELYYKKSE